jgi:hypothetical protein
LGQRPQLTLEFSLVELSWLEILVGFHDRIVLVGYESILSKVRLSESDLGRRAHFTAISNDEIAGME